MILTGCRIMAETKCIIQVLGMDDLLFVGVSGDYTTDLQEAQIFYDPLEAQLYIEKHGMERLAIVRKIVHK